MLENDHHMWQYLHNIYHLNNVSSEEHLNALSLKVAEIIKGVSIYKFGHMGLQTPT